MSEFFLPAKKAEGKKVETGGDESVQKLATKEKHTDDDRADIICAYLEGARLNQDTKGNPKPDQNGNSVMEGLDGTKITLNAVLLSSVLDSIKGGISKSHLATMRTEFRNGPDNYYFVGVWDNASQPNLQIFCKKGANFSIAKGTFWDQLDDKTRKDLEAKGNKARKKES
jgi:hypothetical protein